MASIKKNFWCKKTGCNKFATKNGFCEEHQYMFVDKRKAHLPHCPEAYNNEWRKVRNAYFNDHPLCEDCEKRGRTTPAREIHHIIPIENGGGRLDVDNLISLCSACHHLRHRELLENDFINQQLKEK